MAAQKPIRVIIADDHKLFRSGIISLLEDVEEVLIVAEVESGTELIEKYVALTPDIILVDISMPGMGGIEAIKILRKKFKDIKALILSMYDSEEYVYYAMKSGARGMLSKNTLKGELVHALKTVYSGARYYGVNLSEAKIAELEKKYRQIVSPEINPEAELTSRDKMILEYISMGLTSVEMAAKMDVSKKTIDYYRARLMQTLKIKTAPELISYAVRYSLMNRLFEE